MSAYAYDASKPHRLASATIGGESHKFVHDADGNIEKYDCVPATCDDRFVEWSGRNLPVRITVGGGKTDATPTARDEFAYGLDGARYHRKTSHMDGATLRTEHTYHVGAFEELLPPPGAAHASIGRTRVTDAVRHVRTTSVEMGENGEKKTTTKKYFEYVHKDHLGSPEATTDAAGKLARTRAHDPFGGRRKTDWTAALTPAELGDLADSPDPPERGHTGHEHLDRTGFIHRGGRVYDPTLGRFLSPDPLVGNPASAQSWNGYAYVSNSPMSFVDPSGLSQAPARPGCVMVGFMCRGQGGGAARGGFGLETVVSTFSFWFVDVLVSWTPIRNSDPDWIFGGSDSHDPFRYEYVYRQGGISVTSQVPVAGVLNITRRPIGLPNFDRGYHDRYDPRAAVHLPVVIGILVREGFRQAAKWLGKRWARDKQGNKEKEERTRANQHPTRPEGSIESVEDVFSNPSSLEGRNLERVQSEIGDTPGWIQDVMRSSRSHPEGGWVLRELNRRGDNFTDRMIQYHPGTWRHFDGKAYWKVSEIPNQRPVRVPAGP